MPCSPLSFECHSVNTPSQGCVLYQFEIPMPPCSNLCCHLSMELKPERPLSTFPRALGACSLTNTVVPSLPWLAYLLCPVTAAASKTTHLLSSWGSAIFCSVPTCKLCGVSISKHSAYPGYSWLLNSMEFIGFQWNRRTTTL